MKSESDIKWHTVACLCEWIKARIQYGELFENGPPLECGEPLSNTPNASTVCRNRSRCCTRLLLWNSFERSFNAECSAKASKHTRQGLLVLLPRFWGGAFLLQPCKDAMVLFNRKGVVGFLHKRTSGARNKESEWRSEDRRSTVIHTANEHRTESSQSPSPSLCLQFTSSMQSDSVQDLHRSWETSKLRCQNTSHITSQHESTWWSWHVRVGHTQNFENPGNRQHSTCTHTDTKTPFIQHQKHAIQSQYINTRRGSLAELSWRREFKGKAILWGDIVKTRQTCREKCQRFQKKEIEVRKRAQRCERDAGRIDRCVKRSTRQRWQKM